MSQKDLKAIWQDGKDDFSGCSKDAAGIRQILETKASGAIQRVRRRIVIESLIYLAMIYAFIDLFDAGKHHWYIQVFGFGVIVLGIVNNLLLHRLSSPDVQGEDLRAFLLRNIRRLGRQLNFRIVFFILFVLAIMALLMPPRYAELFSSAKGWLFIAVAGLSMAAKVIVETRMWKKYIKQLNECLFELKG
jgi:hypothetical protein